MKLSELKQKERATVVEVGGNGVLRQHFLDMGMIPGVEVMVEKRAPMGDPIELRLHGFALALRAEDAEKIIVTAPGQHHPEAETAEQTVPQENSTHEIEHPGLGEEGQAAQEKGPKRTPKKHLSFALVGNQNCGKTTLFNQLTGARQHVGNFPGVTVERKDGSIKGRPEATVTDLPGIYSLSPYTNEEVVSRQFILENHPDALINIVDATNIERNLYLTMQLMELDIPMVLALNMMDEVEGNGGTVRINELDRSATYIKSRGMYTMAEREMIFLVVSRRQLSQVQRKIKNIDPKAFLVVTDAYDTYGEGFKSFTDNNSVLE